MKSRNQFALFIFITLLMTGCGKKNEISYMNDISKQDWYIWLDEKATWINDSLHLPPVKIENLPENPPSCGWDKLFVKNEQKTTLPATVEEYFWDKTGNHYGISGNYKGVSWFFTTLNIPETLKGKLVSLCFESVRMRSEIYVNNKLAGYDIIDGTLFQVNISDFVKYGENNQIAVRITDPNGNFNWRDSRQFKWGKYTTISSHGFGGITGKVYLKTTDNIYIDDIFVKNKSDITSADIQVQLNNEANTEEEGKLSYEIIEKKYEGRTVFTHSKTITVKKGQKHENLAVNIKDALLWSLDEPNLYVLKVKWEGKHGTKHLAEKVFGFRWFNIVEENGDRMFFLNNKRIVLRTSISWSFWPVNGMYPTEELAEKQILVAKKLGLNMLNFHRAIGTSVVFDEADNHGLLYYEEPGAYRTAIDSFSREWMREKVLRMIKRDRSHPSLVIYNMQNEIGRDPFPFDKETIKLAHEADETRIITYTSTNFKKELYGGLCPTDTAEIKMHMLPYNHQIQYFGFWDQHHAGGPGCYADHMYNSPEDYLRYSDNKPEIIFYGEEGAIGTPPLLPKMVEEINKTGKKGWDGQLVLDTYEAYDKFLKEKGFYNHFSDMGSLITSMGNVALYYQGRIIENIRANNTVDGYAVNGWESEKIENHSGIVDCYRNIKGDPGILAYYNQPAYIAVKIRNKVFELGDTALADIYIINETGIKGKCTLNITCTDSSGLLSKNSYDVDILGGNDYGQLLKTGLEFVPSKAGYCNVTAELEKNGKVLASGKDLIFTVKITPDKTSETVAYMEEQENSVFDMLSSAKINCKPFKGGFFSRNTEKGANADDIPDEKVLVAGNIPPDKFSRNQIALLDWIMDGNTLIIIKNAEKWAEFLNKLEVVDYRSHVVVGNTWFGGNHFVREHPVFKDLPVNCAFNWEYQSLALYKRNRIGLRLSGEECIVGVQCEHKPELFTSVGIIPLGRGKIIISALDLEGAIKSGEKSAIVAKKILRNYIEYSLNNN